MGQATGKTPQPVGIPAPGKRPRPVRMRLPRLQPPPALSRVLGRASVGIRVHAHVGRRPPRGRPTQLGGCAIHGAFPPRLRVTTRCYQNGRRGTPPKPFHRPTWPHLAAPAVPSPHIACGTSGPRTPQRPAPPLAPGHPPASPPGKPRVMRPLPRTATTGRAAPPKAAWAPTPSTTAPVPSTAVSTAHHASPEQQAPAAGRRTRSSPRRRTDDSSCTELRPPATGLQGSAAGDHGPAQAPAKQQRLTSLLRRAAATDHRPAAPDRRPAALCAAPARRCGVLCRPRAGRSAAAHRGTNAHTRLTTALHPAVEGGGSKGVGWGTVRAAAGRWPGAG